MAIQAALFVNWIFWAALGSGTLLVVGVTEWLGGTTRGYRLLMAWLVAVVAAVLLLSELNLPEGTVADATAGPRRTLAWSFAIGSFAYLAATLVRLPRSGLAIVAGLAGTAALATLAAAGGTLSAPLFAIQLILLGHWYLVTPRLSPAPLRRMMWLLVVTLSLQAVAFVVALLAIDTAPLAGEIAWLTWLRLGVGILLPLVVTALAIVASRAASLQASTGLLYIGLALVMAGSIAGASITYLTQVPV
jgi:hypothetical protein